MVILIAGANGFLGRSLANALATRGHVVIGTARHPPGRGCDAIRWVRADYTKQMRAADWVSLLQGVDLVINAAGIFRQRGSQTFEAVHARGPSVLFEACALARVRVLQISALGADEGATSAYHRSKRAGDEALLRMVPSAVVMQPSLVYASHGASASFFLLLATLPVIPVPADAGRVQPIHLEDLVAAVIALVESDLGAAGAHVPLVGPVAVTLREYVSALRSQMGLGGARFLAVPRWAANLAALIGQVLPASYLTTESLSMLRRGNTADPSWMRRLLGRDARPIAAFVAPQEAPALRQRAMLGWLLPLLRISIATVWIVSGVVSLGVYPVAESYQLLDRVGIRGALAPLALYGAALLDLAFGVASLVLARRRWLWMAQMATILAYTCVITIALPEFWLHPFGPLVKNLPMLAALWMLYELERR
jgi:uncharacterized protein YbjT (DUF2867 family)